MPRAVRKKLAKKCKSEVSRSLTTGNSGAKKSSKTVRFYILPLVVAMICGLSTGAKCLFAKLNSDAWRRSWCRVGVGSLANCLGTDNRSIRRWIRELERWHLIKVGHERKVCCYYLYPKFRGGLFVPLLAETMKRRGVGWAYKLVMCWLSYRQADNDYCWARQKDIAEELGLSVRTVQRVLEAMKARGEVQIRQRGRNRKKGNKYVLTCGAVLGGRIFGASSHTTKCTHLDKTLKLKSYLKAFQAEFQSGDLSASSLSDGFEQEAVYFELVSIDIHEKVAGPMAFIDNHPIESVVNAKNNAKILRAHKCMRSDQAGLPPPKFNEAGYVVAALNGARREGKTVGTTKRFRQAGAMSRALKIAKARRGRWRPLSDAEIAARVRKAKRALGVLAQQKAGGVLEATGTE